MGESMSKVTISQMAFRKAIRISVRVLLTLGCVIGIAFLAPPMAPELLPTPLWSNRKAQSVTDSVLADAAPIPAQQDPLPELVPPASPDEETQPNPPQELPIPIESNLMAENVARAALTAIGPTLTRRDPLSSPAAPAKPQEQAPPKRPQEFPTPLSSSRNTQSVAQPVVTPTAASAQPAPAPPQEPPAYIPPEQLPPKAPVVTYESGQLTIVAENSTLSDILAALRACMGSDIDLPSSASGERMWAKLGPGPARKILAALLSQTNLDYLIQASDSETDPDGIRSVSLTPRTDAPGATVKSRPAFVQALPPRQSDANRRVPVPNRAAAEDRVAEEPVPPPPPVTPEPAAVPDAMPVVPQSAQVPVPETQAIDANKPAATASTGDQMIRMLQNMYQERKQQMQKPPATN